MRPVIVASQVSKSFPSPRGMVPILKRVDIEINAGDFLMITGPSGSGKTTFLNLVALLDRPSAGRLLFGEHEPSVLDEHALCALRAHQVGMVFQRFNLMPRRSVLQNVLFRFRYIEHDRREARARACATLDTLGLSDALEKPARLLSSGEMQRVAIARAVVVRPRLLVADEPTGNLDEGTTRWVMDAFKKLNDDGLTILMVTHNTALLSYASRHLVCHSGVIDELELPS